jgi:peptidyl-dipeptidase A
MKRICLLSTTLALTFSVAACSGNEKFQQEAQAYLDQYAAEAQKLFTASAEAQWQSNTHIVPGDTTNAARTKAADEALAKFTGSIEVIEKVRGFLEQKDKLTPLQVRQFEKMLYLAAGAPQTVPDVVKERIAAEAEQTETLYGFTFKIGEKPVTPNQIDSLLIHSTNLPQRRAVWEASKEVGKALKPGIVKLRDLRNKAVQGLGYSDFFTYQVSDYGMTTDEMLALCDTLISQLRPLYRELHTWARYELAKRYNQPVPDYLPADWLPNRWGQVWDEMVQVEGLDVSAAFKGRTPESVVKAGEEFYMSLGFSPLPQTFWEKSSLYALPADAPYKKNTHASAWHIDLDKDVRSLMSVEANPQWYYTTLHELGHIYYFMEYSNPNVPLLLREGANRAYHEGIGTMMELASSQRKFLTNRGLAPANAQVDSMQQLLKEALNYVVFIPFSAGTMTRFEHDLYTNNLSPDQFNDTWWRYAKQYQGIVPPTARGEEFADALTKTHINDDAAQYYDYAISNVLLFQLHEHIAKNILKQDPHDTDYYGNKEVGNFLKALMAPGASRPWREVLKETTGRPLDAQAMVEYFAPLHEWLKEQNKGRKYTI